MAYSAGQEYTFAYPPTSLNRGQGGFTQTDREVLGRWVQLHANGQVKLALADSTPIGVIRRMDKNGVAVQVGPRIQGPRAGDAAAAVGSKIIGGTRQVTATGSAEPGYADALPSSPSAGQLLAGRGTVINGAAATSANTAAAEIDVLLWT